MVWRSNDFQTSLEQHLSQLGEDGRFAGLGFVTTEDEKRSSETHDCGDEKIKLKALAESD